VLKTVELFFLQLSFFTRIPIPFKIDFDSEKFAKSMIFVPFTGIIIGALSYAVYYAASYLGYRAASIFFVIFFDLLITGGLHYDGLADSSDGLFSSRKKERILEIMKDSRIGSNGVISLIMIFMFKFIFLFIIPEELMLKTLILMPVAGRMNIITASAFSGYAGNNGGMGESIVKLTGIKHFFITLFITALLFYISGKAEYLLLLPVLICFCLIAVSYVKSKIDGITGDIIGAVIVLSESVFLFSTVVLIFLKNRFF